MHRVETIPEYEYCISRGYDPLTDTVNFELPIKLRVELQNEIFGKFRAGIPQANAKFYRYCWDNKPHRCEETLIPLYHYSSVFISHILSRGAHPEMAHDPRNVNILCLLSHAKWENGNRIEMRIYPGNLKIIEQLKREYRSL